jgi:hypothetical protein
LNNKALADSIKRKDLICFFMILKIVFG